jgi:hypothetical protein
MATDTEKMLISLQADIRQYERNMQRALQTTQRRASSMERRFSQLQRRGTAAFAGIGASLGPLLGIGGGAAMISGLARAINELDRVAKRATSLGLTAEQLQVLEFHAERSGVSIEQVGTAMRTMNINAGRAASGQVNEASRAFQALGISAEELRRLSPQQLLERIADGMQKISDPKLRAALASGIFGSRGGVAFLNVLKDGSKGMADMEAAARRLGIVIPNSVAAKAEEAADRMTDLSKVMKTFGTVLAVEVMPGLIALMGHLTSIAQWIAANPKVFAMLTGAAGGAAIGSRGGVVGAGVGGVMGAMTGLGTAAAARGSSEEGRLRALRTEVEALDRALANLDKGLAAPGGYRTGPEEIARFTERRLAATQEIADIEGRIAARTAPRVAPPGDTSGDYEGVDLAGTAAKQKAFDAAVEKIRQQTVELDAQTNATDRSAKAVAVLSAEMELLAALTKDNTDLTPELRAEIEALAEGLGRARSRAAMQEMMEETEAAISELEAYTATLGKTAVEADIFAFEQDLVNKALKEFGAISAEARREINEMVSAYRLAREAQEKSTVAMENQIMVQDGVRQGLIDIGLAATRGADDFGDAVGNMLRRIADLILELYVLKPLIESIFGSMGSSGGSNWIGALGSALGRAIGFSSGTANTGGRRGEPRGVVHGQEAVIPLPAGGKVPVQLRMPDLSRMAPARAQGGTVINNHIDARGATDPEAVNMAVQRGMREVLAQVPGLSVRSVAAAKGRGGSMGRALA